MLPAEIRTEVVSYLLCPDFDDFFDARDGLDWDTLKYFGPPRDAYSAMRGGAWIRTSFYTLQPDIKSLCNVRLVSRDWLTAVNAVLEKHLWWNAEVGSREKLQRVASACSPNAEHVHAFAGNPVKRLMIPSIEDALAFERIFTYEWDQPGEEVLETADRRIRRDETNLLSENPFKNSHPRELIDRIFSRLGNIEALSLSFPEALSDWDNGAEGKAYFYDMEVIDSCVAFFQNALANPSFQFLADLTLNLPCTYHVGDFAKCLDQQARERLLHLKIGIKDCTGDMGCRENYVISGFEIVERDGDVQGLRSNDFPFSNVQRQFPNQGCQDAMWDFVASCPNLSCLCIVATQFLDVARLDWKKSPKSRGLRVLSLDRVWVSVAAIKSLLQPHSASSAPPALRRINIYDAKLHIEGGNWEDLFVYLKENCPSLECGKLGQLTYFEDHPRNDYEEHHDEEQFVWSTEETDKEEYSSLNEMLIERAGGREFYPQSLVEYLS
ncbi:unnamed protein product [Clonostachys byssicola]|uniref:Uncharacterized protein n=1 Tax=Clonostachys byssicola TaxID=160290 RepID=A0A9N9U3L2_9HYPO|nr:unnamed protein product [Clonostachys byssicola]